MDRLTTDNPNGNFERLMNFAFAKDGEVMLRGARADGRDVNLNEYISDFSKKEYIRADFGLDPNEIPETCLDGCFCVLGALFAAATQAAELRARLKHFEDLRKDPDELRDMHSEYIALKSCTDNYAFPWIEFDIGDKVVLDTTGIRDINPGLYDGVVKDFTFHRPFLYTNISIKLNEFTEATVEIPVEQYGKRLFCNREHAAQVLGTKEELEC